MNKETNLIEYKQQLLDDLEKEAFAFLNYREGGIIYIGIDKTGNPIVPDNLFESQPDGRWTIYKLKEKATSGSKKVDTSVEKVSTSDINDAIVQSVYNQKNNSRKGATSGSRKVDTFEEKVDTSVEKGATSEEKIVTRLNMQIMQKNYKRMDFIKKIRRI
jgi:hypothetical protein